MPTIEIWGKSYTVEVRDGVRFVNGMTVDKFAETLSSDDIENLAWLGRQALKNEQKSNQ